MTATVASGFRAWRRSTPPKLPFARIGSEMFAEHNRLEVNDRG